MPGYRPPETESKSRPAESLSDTERMEALEAAIDARYEDFLAEHDPVNAGNDGLIYRMSIEEMPPDLKAALAESGISVESTSAVKLLKVYTRGKARQEYETHRRAFELTEAAFVRGEKVARVPRPLDCRRLTITDDTKRILNGRGAVLSGNEVEILAMDFVNGKDLLDICNRWIYDHAPAEYRSVVETLDPEDHLQLMKAVSLILKYNHMPPQGTPEESLELSERREKSLKFLGKSRFRLSDAVIEKIANTRRILESNGIYHNDDHERNFMIEGDITGETGEPEIYEIDFGRAGAKPETEIRFFLEKHLAPLTPGFEAAARLRQDREQKQLNEKIGKIAGTPAIGELAESLVKAAAQTGSLEQVMRNRAGAAASSETGLEQFVGALLRLVQDGHLKPGQADGLVREVRQGLVVSRKKAGKTVKEIRNPYLYRAIERYRELFQ